MIAIEDEYNDNYAGIKFDKADPIAISLSVTPGNYQGVMDTEQIQKGDAITLEKIRTEMNTLVCTTKGKAASEDNGGGEVALAGFKGNCHNCGEPGHRKFECPNKGREKMLDEVEMEMMATSPIDSMETSTTVVRKGTSRMINGRRKKTRTIAPITGKLQVIRQLQPLTEMAALKLFSCQQMV